MAPLLYRKRVLAAAIEATVGTAETLAAGDAAMNVFDADIQQTADFVERMGQSALSPLPGVVAGRPGQVTFRTEMHASGSDGAPKPLWAQVLLPAVGLVDASDTDVFTVKTGPPADGANETDLRTLTIGVYENGLLKKLSGCMGNAVFNFPAGGVATIDWTFTGVWAAPTDTAILAPTYPTVTPLRFASATMTLGGAAVTLANLSIDLGNQVTLREDATKAAGYIAAIITGRNITGTMDPEAALVATRDDFGNWLAGTEQALAIAMNNGAGEEVDFAAPKLQITNPQEANRNGLLANQLAFQLNRSASAGDDELTITFT